MDKRDALVACSIMIGVSIPLTLVVLVEKGIINLPK